MKEDDAMNNRPVHPLPYRSILQEMLWTNRTVIAASSAAVVGVVAGYPFDSVKTRMQTEPYDSIKACVKQTYKEEGIRGFFRGVLPPLVTVSIIKSVSFSVYEQSKAFCKAHFPFMRQDQLSSVMAISTVGGAVSGAFIATFSCPFELVKIHKQLEFLLQASSISTGATVVRAPSEQYMKDHKKKRQTVNRTVGAGIPIAPSGRGATHTSASERCRKQHTATSSWHSAREIIRNKGFFGLWSGFSLHFVRDTVGTSVYFGGYETTKYLLTSADRPAGPVEQFLAGGICGILCWLAVFPVDLVKSLIQKEVLTPKPAYKSTLDCVRDIYHTRGARGFYRGIAVTLMRAFPIHSLNFLVYEQTLRLVRYASHHTEYVSL